MYKPNNSTQNEMKLFVCCRQSQHMPGVENEVAASDGGGEVIDKSYLRVYLPNGGFNVVRCGDATQIKVTHT